MKVEEFASVELVNKVRIEVKALLDRLEYPDDFRRDRLLTEITREICLSYV